MNWGAYILFILCVLQQTCDRAAAISWPSNIFRGVNKSQQFKVSLSFVDFEQNAAKMQFIGPPTVQRIILL